MVFCVGWRLYFSVSQKASKTSVSIYLTDFLLLGARRHPRHSYLTAPTASIPGGPPSSPHPPTVFLCICDRTYPRLLAFSYLLELSKAFFAETVPEEIRAAVRPYAFIRFENAIQSAKKRYLNTRSLRTADNLAELSASLQSVETWRAEDAFGAEYAPPRASGPGLPKLNLQFSVGNLVPEGVRGEGPPSLFRNAVWKWFMLLLGAVVGVADWWYGSQCLDYLFYENYFIELGVSLD